MKQRNKYTLILCFLMPAALFAADDTLVVDDADEPAPSPTPVKIATVAPSKTSSASSAQPSYAQLDMQVRELQAKNRKLADELLAVKEGLAAVESGVNTMSESVKKGEESAIEIKGITGDLEALKKRVELFEEKYAKDSSRTEQFVGEFTDIKESFRQKIDKMQGWNDVMEVLKKEINNNETEIARMKKEVSGLKKQYQGGEDDAFNSIIRSPYVPVAALVISIVAFITAMVR